MELLQTTWSFVWGLALMGWDLLLLGSTFLNDSLQYLHNDAPRLEGLLLGVALSWLLLRRDRHPLLKVLSAPLKLVLDILDLAWDQCMDLLGDARDTLKGLLGKSWGLAAGLVKGAWGKMMGLLNGLKNKLKRS